MAKKKAEQERTEPERVVRDGLKVIDCNRCPRLAESRQTIVNGRGPKDAKVVIVGQAPGREEDTKGRPFIGPAGQTLKLWLEKAGLDPVDDVYYVNACRCLPPLGADNKEDNPTTQELANCRPFLEEELREIDPQIIVPAGNIALEVLYGKEKITDMRGAVLWSDEFQKRMVPIMHPASAFHTFSNEFYGIADLNKVKRELKRPNEPPDTRLGKYRVYLEADAVEELADRIEAEAGALAFDTETTSLDWQTAQVLCVGFSWKEREAHVVPVMGRYAKRFWRRPGDYERVIAALRRIFESSIPKIAQNGKFDRLMLRHALGIEVNNFAFDTMLAYHLFFEEQGHSLDTLCNLYTDMGDYSRDIRPYKKDMRTAPLRMLWRYQAADADCTLRVALVLDEMLDKEPKLRWIFENIAMPMSGATERMEERGILIDAKDAEEVVETYDRLVAEEKAKLLSQKGVPQDLNHRSDQQVRKLLFETLGLDKPSIVTAKKKEPSVKVEALEEIREQAPEVIDPLVMLTKLEQVQKTFLTGIDKPGREDQDKGLLNKVSKIDGRLHTSFRVDGTETGRLSSSPNIQNIVGEGKSAKEATPIRQLFVAPEGYEFLVADLSQVELRILAYESGDEAMIAAFESGADVHEATARVVFGIPANQPVPKELRRRAKTINFGLGYGMTEVTLAKRLNDTEENARRFLNQYFGKFSKLEDFFMRQRRRVRSKGVVENVFGRQRRFYGVKTMQHYGRYKMKMGHIYRQSYNFPIQSSASDIHSLITVALDRDGFLSDNGVYIVLSVHDSLGIEVPKENVVAVAQYVKRRMTEIAAEVTEQATGRAWVIPADVEWGPRWEDVTQHLGKDASVHNKDKDHCPTCTGTEEKAA